MKITRLNLARFRSYLGIVFDMNAPRILIAGLNGSGKTSVREGIKWALTGRCDGTDGKGAGAEVLVPTGSKDAHVIATLDTIGEVERTYGLTGGGSLVIENITGTSQIQQQALYIKLDTTPAFIDAVLDTEAFLKLNHIEGKALVLSLLGVKFDVPLLGGTGAVAFTCSLDQLDAKYRQAFDERKAAKKALQNVFLAPKPVDAQLPAIEKIDAQLTALRKDLGDKRQAVGTVTGRRDALQMEMVRLQRLPAVGEDLSNQIFDLEERLALMEQESAPAQPPAAGDPKRLIFLRNTVEALQRHNPKNGCVFDGKIPCKTPLASFTARQADFVSELKGMDPKPAVQAESPMTTLRKQLTDLQGRQQAFEAAMTHGRDADVRLAAIRQELDDMPDTAAQDAEIATLEGRIQKGVTLLTDARTYVAAAGAYADSLKTKQQAEAEVARLEALVEQLGPTGVRVKALTDAMGKFQSAVNPYVKAFGWDLSFSVDPWEVFANGRPVETYSTSERFRIGIALQLGIAQLSGLNFAVVDAIDMLTVENRSAVTKMLLTAPLEQIIILGSREDSQALPSMKDLISYRLAQNDGCTFIADRVPV